MLIAALLLAQAAPALPCTATDFKLPPPFGGWTQRASALAPGRTVVLTPDSPGSFAFAADRIEANTPGKAAMAQFTITRPGIYGLALDQKAWIDVYPGNATKPLGSVAHGHGPQCSTIRKVVRFKLVRGSYTALLSRIEQPTARLMLVADK